MSQRIYAAPQEIFNLSRSDALSIWHHIYGDDRVVGVRAVQQLQKSVLYFPAPKPPKPDPERDRASGGGPRRPGGLK